MDNMKKTVSTPGYEPFHYFEPGIGWVCVKCKRSWAPAMLECPACNKPAEPVEPEEAAK